MANEVVNLADPDTFLAGPPMEHFAHLRKTQPVSWQKVGDGPGFWAVTSHAGVATVSRDPKTFSSFRNTSLALATVPPDLLALEQLDLINMDPPEHTRLRALVSRLFTPRAVNLIHRRIQDFSVRIIDSVIERGECDFVTDIATPLPLWVICDLLGIPESDWSFVVGITNALAGHDDPEFAITAREAAVKRSELDQYFSDFAKSKRSDSNDDDIITVLLRGDENGTKLSDRDFSRFCSLLAGAGNETTRNAITHSVIALLKEPNLWAQLSAEGAVTNVAVEEFLRFSSPVMRFMRVAQCDTVVDGQAIPEGDKLAVYYISANRDESVFQDPNKLDLARTPNPHMTFGGGGIHFCIGAALARAEISVMLSDLARRMPDLQIVGPPTYVRSTLLHAIKRLPVTFSATHA